MASAATSRSITPVPESPFILGVASSSYSAAESSNDNPAGSATTQGASAGGSAAAASNDKSSKMKTIFKLVAAAALAAILTIGATFSCGILAAGFMAHRYVSIALGATGLMLALTSATITQTFMGRWAKELLAKPAKA